jgi:hypothetical protein
MVDNMKTKAMYLAEEITSFLTQHGKKLPEIELDEIFWTSPDACELDLFAQQIRAGMKPLRVPLSEWGSGGYKPYADKKAQQWHEEILAKCAAAIGRIRRDQD